MSSSKVLALDNFWNAPHIPCPRYEKATPRPLDALTADIQGAGWVGHTQVQGSVQASGDLEITLAGSS